MPSLVFACADYASVFSYFSLDCVGYPRHLHSFPTRRSSDLVDPMTLAIVRKMMDEKGLLERDDFDDALREVSADGKVKRSEEHTSELQSLTNLVCRLLLEKKNKQTNNDTPQITVSTYARKRR